MGWFLAFCGVIAVLVLINKIKNSDSKSTSQQPIYEPRQPDIFDKIMQQQNQESRRNVLLQAWAMRAQAGDLRGLPTPIQPHIQAYLQGRPLSADVIHWIDNIYRGPGE